MEDLDEYPVFFKCPSLEKEHEKRIETYFQNRQRSGGGECGPLERVKDNIYSVAFKDQKDQQRVLEKSEHVVDGLVFTVRAGLRSRTSSIDFSGSIQPEGAVQPEQESTPKRIVLLGKITSGKSSLANTILGETLFKTSDSSSSVANLCQAETRSVHGRNITLIDTPGLFDTERSEEELKPEIVRCITECSPGPHAFLIVLKVERFTEQEEAVVTKICEYFSEEALKYAVIIFTHGDQLPPGMTIEEFVSENKKLSDLVKKCGGRCHVIDNKYWKNNEEDDYRNNHVQVEKLLHTIDKMVMENKGGFYTNEMLQETERQIQSKVKHIRQTGGDLTEEQSGSQAEAEVPKKFLPRLAGVATGAVAAAGLSAVAGVGISLAVVAGVAGGVIGYKASEGAETPGEAAKKVIMDVYNKVKSTFAR